MLLLCLTACAASPPAAPPRVAPAKLARAAAGPAAPDAGSPDVGSPGDGAQDAGAVVEEPADTCEPARARFEASLAPAFDRCVGPHHRAIGESESTRHGSDHEPPIGIGLLVGADGTITDILWEASTGWGPRIARCALAAVKRAPFREPDCAGRHLHVARAYRRRR